MDSANALGTAQGILGNQELATVLRARGLPLLAP